MKYYFMLHFSIQEKRHIEAVELNYNFKKHLQYFNLMILSIKICYILCRWQGGYIYYYSIYCIRSNKEIKALM
jgi:hypothetical protein